MKTRKFQETADRILADPARAANVKRHRAEAVAEIIAYNLGEMRRAREITQVELAKSLGLGQPSVSRVENADDVLISTLQDYVEAMGGHLVLYAEFEDGERFPIALGELSSAVIAD